MASDAEATLVKKGFQLLQLLMIDREAGMVRSHFSPFVQSRVDLGKDPENNQNGAGRGNREEVLPPTDAHAQCRRKPDGGCRRQPHNPAAVV